MAEYLLALATAILLWVISFALAALPFIALGLVLAVPMVIHAVRSTDRDS